ncbi:metalloregulator ArsR/SmtB family transcription factor [Gramella sp. AN32]|uniref:ArsR/SmtB family transcription factor n=1 Tax=Christiangramia antarctica TaxID=2058158 RepID=A0ABW5X9Y4_9FLAO|nr:metalloregulator ArsR/SmtB family transcription factor [Gramella sp. AN32]MCM4155516.1 transcriptional regulator [Gramella sp. AN32]
MGLTKSEKFSAEQNELSSICKVLAHPARIAILQHLYKIDSCICGDLVEEIGLAQPTISQHLRELKQVGLIQGTIEGTSVCYCINKDRWLEMRNQLNEFLDLEFISGKNCC